jgi:hypothetical protein
MGTPKIKWVGTAEQSSLWRSQRPVLFLKIPYISTKAFASELVGLKL